MTKLKPCPFCGGEAEFEWWLGRKGFEASVSCECGALVTEGIYYDSQAEAEERTVKAWNQRHEPPTPGGAIVPAGNKRMKKPLKKCLQCNAVIEYNNIRLNDMGYSCCPHCQSNRLKTIYEVVYG